MVKIKITKGEKQFVSAFFPLKKVLKFFKIFYTYQFRIGILEKLKKTEERLDDIEEYISTPFAYQSFDQFKKEKRGS